MGLASRILWRAECTAPTGARCIHMWLLHSLLRTQQQEGYILCIFGLWLYAHKQPTMFQTASSTSSLEHMCYKHSHLWVHPATNLKPKMACSSECLLLFCRWVWMMGCTRGSSRAAYRQVRPAWRRAQSPKPVHTCRQGHRLHCAPACGPLPWPWTCLKPPLKQASRSCAAKLRSVTCSPIFWWALWM